MKFNQERSLEEIWLNYSQHTFYHIQENILLLNIELILQVK